MIRLCNGTGVTRGCFWSLALQSLKLNNRNICTCPQAYRIPFFKRHKQIDIRVYIYVYYIYYLHIIHMYMIDL